MRKFQNLRNDEESNERTPTDLQKPKVLQGLCISLTMAKTARAHAEKAAVAVFSTVGNGQEFCKTAPFSELTTFIPLDSSSLTKKRCFSSASQNDSEGEAFEKLRF